MRLPCRRDLNAWCILNLGTITDKRFYLASPSMRTTLPQSSFSVQASALRASLHCLAMPSVIEIAIAVASAAKRGGTGLVWIVTTLTSELLDLLASKYFWFSSCIYTLAFCPRGGSSRNMYQEQNTAGCDCFARVLVNQRISHGPNSTYEVEQQDLGPWLTSREDRQSIQLGLSFAKLLSMKSMT